LTLRILFIGDIVGRPGRELMRRGLAALVDLHQADFVVANVENAAAGFGITREIGDQLLESGVDVMTSGRKRSTTSAPSRACCGRRTTRLACLAGEAISPAPATAARWGS
jgi:hypothetical protein